MLEPKANYQVEGNQMCVDFLKACVQRAEMGQTNFCAIIMTEGPNASGGFYVNHIGVIGTEMVASFAAKKLNKDIDDGVFKRMPPQEREDAPPDAFGYNVAGSPTSFDFLTWLEYCDMVKRSLGCTAPLRIAFSFGSSPDYRTALVTPQRTHMFDNVVLPLVKLMGGTVDQSILSNCRWPQVFTHKPITDMFVNEKVPLPKLTPSPDAFAKIDAILRGRTPVVITLREAEHWEFRNSRVADWLRFAETIKEDLIIVRDTAVANEPLPDGYTFETCPEASLCVDVRSALYERARCNLFVGNGPATLAWISSKPWLMFAPLDPSGAYEPGRTDWWKISQGVAAGDQLPWAKPDQRIVWDLDTYDVLCREWEKFSPSLAEAA